MSGEEKLQKANVADVDDGLNSAVSDMGSLNSGKNKARTRVHLMRGAAVFFFVAVAIFSLAFHSGLGTPSSMGISTFYLICPLGGIEALLASHTFIPQALISLLVVVIVCLVVGRAWCAWGCPTHAVRKIFASKDAHAEVGPPARRSFLETLKQDKRLWVLGGFLIAVTVVALPIFCLVCPIGLTFGTIISVWRLIQFADLNWGLLVFPAALIIELVVYKKWCLKICPIGGMLALFGRFAKAWRPKVNESTCLHSQGIDCKICKEVCIETIDLHKGVQTQAELADCTRCAECKVSCPTQSISMPFLPKK